MRSPQASVLFLGLYVVLPVFPSPVNADGRSPAAASPPGAWAALGTALAGPSFSRVDDLAVLGNQLVAAGSFSLAGGQPAGNIAAWDGAAWSPLGSGLNFYVNAIAAHDGQLVAVGGFTEAGAVFVNHVAVWDGVGWSALGTGLNGNPTGVASFNGKIFAARTQAFPPFGVQQAYVEWWNPAVGTWFNAGTFSGDQSDFITIFGFDVVDAQLCVGGEYMYGMAAYSGTAWTNLGQSAAVVRAFEKFGSDLFTGGYDALVEKQTGPLVWTSLDPAWIETCGQTSDLHAHNGMLVAGGSFSSPGCMPHPQVNAWDGSSWSPLGTGMNGSVRALAEFDGRLIAGGYFTTADGNPAGLIAMWVATPVAVQHKTLGGVKALYSGKKP